MNFNTTTEWIFTTEDKEKRYTEITKRNGRYALYCKKTLA